MLGLPLLYCLLYNVFKFSEAYYFFAPVWVQNKQVFVSCYNIVRFAAKGCLKDKVILLISAIFYSMMNFNNYGSFIDKGQKFFDVVSGEMLAEFGASQNSCYFLQLFIRYDNLKWPARI